MLNFGLKLVEPRFREKINKALKERLNTLLRKAGLNIQRRIRTKFKNNILNSVFVKEFTRGGSDLQAELGVPHPMEKMLKIIDIWTNSIVVKHKKMTGTTEFRGGLRLRMIKNNWSDVIDISGVSVITSHGSDRKETPIPWLKWLLIEGSRIVVQDWDVVFVRDDPRARRNSRTGLAIMREGAKRTYWRVPEQHQGTTNDNFVTRAIEKLTKDLDTIVFSEISKRFK